MHVNIKQIKSRHNAKRGMSNSDNPSLLYPFAETRGFRLPFPFSLFSSVWGGWGGVSLLLCFVSVWVLLLSSFKCSYPLLDGRITQDHLFAPRWFAPVSYWPSAASFIGMPAAHSFAVSASSPCIRLHGGLCSLTHAMQVQKGQSSLSRSFIYCT